MTSTRVLPPLLATMIAAPNADDGGAFPAWLAPEQVRVLSIGDAHAAHSEQLAARLRAAGVRAQADVSSDRINAKVRSAQLMKVPYMLVIGDREVAEGTVSLRRRDGSRENDLAFDTFMTTVTEKIATRAATLL